MAIKKITLNELENLVKQIIKEEKNFYPETKEMSYSNISDVKNTLVGLNKMFINLSPIVKENDGKFGNVSYNDFAYQWRKLEESIKLLNHNLKIE